MFIWSRGLYLSDVNYIPWLRKKLKNIYLKPLTARMILGPGINAAKRGNSDPEFSNYSSVITID